MDQWLPNPVEFHGNQLTIKCYNFYDFNDFSMSLISHLGNKIDNSKFRFTIVRILKKNSRIFKQVFIFILNYKNQCIYLF